LRSIASILTIKEHLAHSQLHTTDIDTRGVVVIDHAHREIDFERVFLCFRKVLIVPALGTRGTECQRDDRQRALYASSWLHVHRRGAILEPALNFAAHLSGIDRDLPQTFSAFNPTRELNRFAR